MKHNPCKNCQSVWHTKFKCPLVKRKPLNKIGPVTRNWFADRKAWIKNNPPDHQGYWYCYLRIAENCQGYMTADTLTVDHVIARTRDQSKRRNMDNLKPACIHCNNLKGSKNLYDL